MLWVVITGLSGQTVVYYRMLVQPFVGICGLQTSTEFSKLLHRAPDLLNGTNYFLMVGIKKVTDTLIIPGRFDMVRPFVHCSFTSQEPFEYTIERHIQQSQAFIRGLQLNVLPWMEIDFAPVLEKTKRQHPDIALILQAHRTIVEQYPPRQVAARLRGLPVEYILFDPSQSRGALYDPQLMRPHIDAIYRERLPIGIVVAGGLSGSALDSHFAPLTRTYSNLSCDAFGQLQNPATKTLSWPRVDAYLAAWRKSLTF